MDVFFEPPPPPQTVNRTVSFPSIPGLRAPPVVLWLMGDEILPCRRARARPGPQGCRDQTLGSQDCDWLESFPDELCELGSLQSITLAGCGWSWTLPENFGNLQSLTFLRIEDCCRLQNVPDNIDNLVTPWSLHMECAEWAPRRPVASLPDVEWFLLLHEIVQRTADLLRLELACRPSERMLTG